MYKRLKLIAIALERFVARLFPHLHIHTVQCNWPVPKHRLMEFDGFFVIIEWNLIKAILQLSRTIGRNQFFSLNESVGSSKYVDSIKAVVFIHFGCKSFLFEW